jgi:hypothetical protein
VRDACWRVEVDSKFGSMWGGWCSLKPVGAFGVRLWKNIRKRWDTFSGFVRFDCHEIQGTLVGVWNLRYTVLGTTPFPNCFL